MNPFKKAFENLGPQVTLTFLAESAACLAHDAIDLRRSMTRQNGNPANIGRAKADLYVEIAALQNFLTILDAGGMIDKEAVERLREINMNVLTEAMGGGA